MKTFNQELKSALVAEIIKHREQDRVVQGTYGHGNGKNFRGCAVGCSIHSLFIVTGEYYSPRYHQAYEKELGIPTVLGELQDVIHEGLSDEDFPTWPERFMEAVPTEADLSLVFPRFALWLLSDEVYGVLHKVETDEEREVISSAIGLCSRTITNGAVLSASVWEAVADKTGALATTKQRPVWATTYLCFALRSGVGTRTNIDNALRQGYLAISADTDLMFEEYHKLCADKLIELLKAEGKNGV